jgi:hypothetical protein
MKVYKISSDVTNYQWIMPESEKDLFGALAFDCESKKKDWKPVDMYVFNPKKKKGNFYSLGGVGALVFDEQTLEIMRTVFEMSGEILPLNLDGSEIYALNVLECVNALDQKNTKWEYYDNGEKRKILNHFFHRSRITESSIFKIPETSKTQVLTYSEIKDPMDEFFSLYMKYNLRGLQFEEIYNIP